MSKNPETITLPKKSVRDFLKIMHSFADFEDELEDYLMFQDKELVKKLKKSRKDHLAGKVMDWAELKKKYGL